MFTVYICSTSFFKQTTTLLKEWETSEKRNVTPGDMKIGQFEIWRCRMGGNSFYECTLHIAYFSLILLPYSLTYICVCLLLLHYTMEESSIPTLHVSGNHLSFRVRNKNDSRQLWTARKRWMKEPCKIAATKRGKQI